MPDMLRPSIGKNDYNYKLNHDSYIGSGGSARVLMGTRYDEKVFAIKMFKNSVDILE
jgi:hypothetical protein